MNSQTQTVLTDGGSKVQLGRYTSKAATPEESTLKPLEVVAYVHFPRSTVGTVGEAIRHTLLRTGYSLPDPAALPIYERRVLDLTLPESQRVLGPFRVKDILQVLLGPAWQLNQDDIQRMVWFSVAPAYATALQSLQTPPQRTSGNTAHLAPVEAANEWTISPYENWLSSSMDRWAQRAGAKLVWAMEDDYPLTLKQPRIYKGTLLVAMRAALADVSPDLTVSFDSNLFTITKKVD
ncbi:MAG: hypothetical protein ORN29_09825 [Rhodoferax sp.]|nr:hypothetical protein [Rhodoferax sp.]